MLKAMHLYFQKSNKNPNIERVHHNNSLLNGLDREPCIAYRGKFLPDSHCARMSFGTPSYPSPLDRIRSGNHDRKSVLCMSPLAVENASFEGNQSFPKVSRSKFQQGKQGMLRKLKLENFKG